MRLHQLGLETQDQLDGNHVLSLQSQQYYQVPGDCHISLTQPPGVQEKGKEPRADLSPGRQHQCHLMVQVNMKPEALGFELQIGKVHHT